MPRTQKQRQEELTHLYKLCDHAKTPITHRNRDMQEIDRQLAVLEGTTCTGKIHWRDNSNGKTPKMIIIHSANQSCPLHGKPKPGSRLRSYVGTDPGKQAQANHAIADEAERNRLQRKRDNLKAALGNAGCILRDFYSALGYRVPRLSESDELPEPNPNWGSFTLRRSRGW